MAGFGLVRVGEKDARAHADADAALTKSTIDILTSNSIDDHVDVDATVNITGDS